MNKVLVIDSDDGSEGLIEPLRTTGFAVFQEWHSDNGLRTAVEVAPQIIIFDESIPPLDGTELVSWLRSFTDSLIIVKGVGKGSRRRDSTAHGSGCLSG